MSKTSWAKTAASGMKRALDATKSYAESGRIRDDSRNATTAVAVGLMHALGSFQQLNRTGQPIFRHESGGTLGMRKVNNEGHGAIYKPTDSRDFLEGLSAAAFALAIARDAYEIGMTAKRDHAIGNGFSNTMVKSSSAAGRWAGGFSAAWIGVAVLSPIAGAGSLIGGIGGGILGSVYGARGAEAVAKAILARKENAKQ